VAFTDASAAVLPPAPSIAVTRDGGSSGGFTWNEIQTLTVPPNFRGSYQLGYGYAKTARLTVADGAAQIQAALIAAMGAAVTYIVMLVRTRQELQDHLAADAANQIAQQAVAKAVDQSMHGELLPARPGVLHDGGMADIQDLLGRIQFDKTVITQFLIVDLFEFIFETGVNISDIS
jgi:hypothetical protein